MGAKQNVRLCALWRSIVAESGRKLLVRFGGRVVGKRTFGAAQLNALD